MAAAITTTTAPTRPGLLCPKCGGSRLRQKWTRNRPGCKVRYRECGGCGYRVRTREIIAGVAGQPAGK